MAIDNERINARAGYGILAGVIIASIALGVIIWQVGKYPIGSLFYTIFIATGAYLAVASFEKDTKLDFAPSESSYYLIVGCLLATVGILGFISVLTTVNMWILVAAFILVVALLVVYRSVSNKG